MAWSELTQQRSRNARLYQDSITGQFQAVSTLAPLHYESVLDSGNFDTALDLSAIRVNNAQLDGWRIANAGFQYAVGIRKAVSTTNDGWVGYGGRKGANWFYFRLVRMGYLHNPTRAWDDVGGAPTYNRVNLSRTINTLPFGPNNDLLNAETVVNWSGLWSTVGGGDVTVRWRVDGNRVKEEIVLNQAGRNWIATNHPPATPLNETYFGFVFEVDWSDIPKALVAGIQQTTATGDFSDDTGGVELRDSLNNLLGFMPIDDLVAGTYSRTNPSSRTPLRKRFFQDVDGKNYLAVGVRCDILNGLQSGPLVFDPTVSYQVAASTDDADSQSNTVASGGAGNVAAADLTNTLLSPGSHGANNYWYTGARFLSVAVPNAATITSATYTMTPQGSYSSPSTIDLLVSGQANDTTVTFAATTGANLSTTARPRTTANTVWTQKTVTVNVAENVSVTSVIQEIVNRAGWASGNSMVIIVEASNVTAGEWQDYYAYDGTPASSPQLSITYAGATAWFPLQRTNTLLRM